MNITDVRDRDGLIQAFGSGKRIKFVFFWGHSPSSNQEIGKECLSQWYPASFVVEKCTYRTAEHYMMAEKARLFGDEKAAQEILEAGAPDAVKQIGRRISPFIEETWVKHRFDIVVRGNVAKFSQNSTLRDFLLQTGDRVLVEASPKDKIWGIGLSQDDPKAENPNLWKGLNLLGFALMEARHRLVNQ